MNEDLQLPAKVVLDGDVVTGEEATEVWVGRTLAAAHERNGREMNKETL